MASPPVPLPPHSKIALLICDPTEKEFIESYGNITNLFTGLYTKLLIRLTGGVPIPDLKSVRDHGILPEVMKSFRVDPYHALDGHLPTDVDAYDSVIVSGSAHGVNDGDTWILKLAGFLHDTATRHPKVKLIGICFGHQIISHAVFGLPVKPNPQGWEIGPYDVHLTDTGKVLFPGKDPLIIEMFHHDAVFTSNQVAAMAAMCKATPYEAPGKVVNGKKQGEVKIWGHSEKTQNQGIVSVTRDIHDRLNVDDIHIFTCQGHPELTQGMTTTLVDLFEHEIDKETVLEARARIAAFKGVLDWYQISLLMWALSTKHTYVFSTASSFNTSDAGAKSKENVFVLVA